MNLNRSHARVLVALEPGGILSPEQIAESTGLPVRTARKAVTELSHKFGYVVNAPTPEKWQLSAAGIGFLKTGAGRSTLDYGGKRPTPKASR